MSKRKTQDIIIFLDETTSTNRYLQDLSQVEKLHEGTSVLASYQSAGRGCGKNTWESQKGKNVLFSTIFFPEMLPVDRQFYMSEIVSVSILGVLKEEVAKISERAATEFSVKWPNDILWRDQKIAGILIENVISGNKLAQTIIGAGININQDQFNDAPNAVSLKQIIGVEYDVNLMFTEFIRKLHFNYIKLLKNEFADIHTVYMGNLYRRSGLHPFQIKDGETFYAFIKRIEPSGIMILETEKGEERSFMFKEIEFIL